MINDGAARAGPTTLHESQARRVVRRFVRHRLAVVGLVVLGLAVAAAVIGPLVVGQDPYWTDLKAISRAPSAAHWLGTDRAGRDVLSRLLEGLRTSLIIGLGAVSLYVAIGTAVGLVAGYRGGAVDQVAMRSTDILLSLPTLLLVIVFVSMTGPSLVSIIIVIGLLGWPGAARLVRAQVLALRQAEFITASRVIGVGGVSIVLKHLLPNILGSITVLFTFGVPSAILLEAGLSFLGLGVRPPGSSLGTMINDAQSATVLTQAPWMWIPAGLTIATLVLAVNFIGDGLRDAFDPRLTGRG